MACSHPLKIFPDDIKKWNPNSKSHKSFEAICFEKSFGKNNYIEVPCNWCLNCRIDKQSQLIDRAEYEYIKYGCGAFVTFTYDDAHLFKNSFIDSHSSKTIATINKKDGKDFLNRLNKLVHKEAEKYKKLKLDNKLCREDYKYLMSYEYGGKFNRPHIHCLFFGLDFAFCERLFWRAWQAQGSIQVGAIKNGGIAYCTKYISEETFGSDAFYKYTYHHLEKPKSTHSLNFGSGLFESQKQFIKKTGYYKWHNETKPCPSYIKNKYNVIADLDYKTRFDKFKIKCKNIEDMYNIKLNNDYNKYREFALNQARITQNNAMKRLQQKGKKVFNEEQFYMDVFKTKYGKQKRINPIYDNEPITIINQFYTKKVNKPDNRRIEPVPF